MKYLSILVPLLLNLSWMLGAIAQTSDRCQGLSPVNCALLEIDLKRDRSAEDMLADLDRLVEEYPRAAEIYRARASWRKSDEVKDYPGAVADLDQAIRLAPKDHELYYERLYLRKKYSQNNQEILQDYGQIIAVNPWAANFYARAKFKQDIKDFQGALEDYNQAIIEGENDVSFSELEGPLTPGARYSTRAQLKHYHLKDFQGALQDYDITITHAIGGDKYAYYHRGLLKGNHLNDRKGAIKDLKRFLKKTDNEFDREHKAQQRQEAQRFLKELKAK